MKKIAIFTSFIIGFLSLGQEVLWIRVLSFAGHSVPHAFAYTLFLYLLGIAIGAFFGKKICQKNKFSLDFLGKLFLTISIFNLLVHLTCFLLCVLYFLYFIYIFYLLYVIMYFIIYILYVVFICVNTIKKEKSKKFLLL